MALYHAIAKWYWKIRKPLTLGVRLIVADEQKGVLHLAHLCRFHATASPMCYSEINNNERA
ncbi:hypothetical protein AAFJ72_03985 [Brevibacillus gelatini]|uniref:hypothetical protein n=1 Tax=Brevibacillus gelatini TaxID=1655277 RepID=UPI001FECFBA6|nr:hypothetical protein [Brevibacillus gelatini]